VEACWLNRIEVKRDLHKERVRREAEDQLAGCIEVRMNQTGPRYVGVLIDGPMALNGIATT